MGLLPDIGCELVRYQGNDPNKADLLVNCGDRDMTIEVKESTLIEKDKWDEKWDVQTYRLGRFQLGHKVDNVPKDCYAFVIDNPFADRVTVDFVKADEVDAFFNRMRETGDFPKLSTYRIFDYREPHNRCFVDVPTQVLDREELTLYEGNGWKKMLIREERTR